METANVRTAPVTAETRPSAETWTSNPMNRPGAAPVTDADELTALRKQQLHDLTISRIVRRAETLWDQGYTLTETYRGQTLAYFTVASPKGDLYHITLSDTPKDELFGDTCDCPSFDRYGACKHHFATLWKEQERAESERIDREWEQAEECRNFFGFDREDF